MPNLFLSPGRKHQVKDSDRISGTHSRRATENDARNKEIRDWARERNLDVNDRSRIPAGIVAQFEAANGK